jgi:mono/diheme cytochrome c family protein
MHCRHRLAWVAIGASMLLTVGGCAIEVQNTQPARELARVSHPPGSVYTGWRVFQEKCARCHGEAAQGGSGPDLLPRVAAMGPRRFIEFVLLRYEWNLPPTASGSVARAAQVDEVLERRAPSVSMPDFGGDPRVTAHIADLHAYLSARAEGRQGPGRPLS